MLSRVGWTTLCLALVASLGPATAATATGAPVPPTPPAAATGAASAPRSVPAYVLGSSVQARSRSGSGDADVAFAARRTGGSVPLWGDFLGTRTQTLVSFRGGRWSVQRSTVLGVGHDPAEPDDLLPTRTFGKRGDLPVVGDWDGNGRTDIGVRRGTKWLLARSVDFTHGGGVPTWRTVTFGKAGTPVAGDWDGRGGDEIGVFSRGTFTLARTLGPRTKTRTVRMTQAKGYHYRRGDQPVVGSWTGAAADSVGIVRGDTWRLRTALGRASTTTVRVTRPAGAVAAPWRTTSGPRGESCPTAAAGFTGLRWTVRPPRSLRTAATASAGLTGPATGVRTALTSAEKHMLGTAYAPWGRQANRVYADLRGTDNRAEYAVRRPAMAALTVAIALSTGAHDAAGTGRTAVEAQRYVDFLVRSLACQHQSVSPGGWGHRFQSDHWASMIAMAAWLTWDGLSGPSRTYVTTMLADEADYQLTLPPDYWRGRDGRDRPGRSGNSAAEETAWTVPLLELAARLTPDAAQARRWRTWAVQRAVEAYSTPSDLHDDTAVNGVPVRDRLEGYNALDDGTVVNHDRVHPDYIGNIQHLWWAADLALLDGGAVPEAYLHHGSLVYGAFSQVSFAAGQPSAAGHGRRYLSPGGTIYRPLAADTNEIYFPDGTDWGLPRRAPFMSLDAHAQTYDLVPPTTEPASGAAWTAADALAAHTRGQLGLIASSGATDGRTYSANPARADDEDRYVGREEYAAQQVATAWLALVVGTLPDPSYDTSTYGAPRTVPGKAQVPEGSKRAVSP